MSLHWDEMEWGGGDEAGDREGKELGNQEDE